MSPEFDDVVQQMRPLMDKLMSQAPKMLGQRKQFPRVPGVYLISDSEGHLYTGRCKNIWQRMGNHGGKSPDSSTFAFRLASKAVNHKATYLEGKGRKELKKDEAFKTAFLSNVALIRAMTVRFVEIEDDATQHMFELYVHMALKTPHNSFATH